MEKYIIDRDIPLICIEATSFPHGVLEAHQKLHKLIDDRSRLFFGLSRPENGHGIIYKAAVAEASPEEAEQLGCERITLKAGTYNSMLVRNFMDDIPAIGRAFLQLLDHPEIDPEGYCVELYENDPDVRCMVRMKTS